MCSCYTAPDANLQRSINEDFWDARLNYGQMWDTEQDEMIWTCGRMTTNKNQTDDKGSHHLKKCRILRKTFSNGGEGGGQSVFILLFRNGPKWSKMAQMVQKCPK